MCKEFTCVDDVLQLLRQLDASKICTGNRSERFSSLAQSHKGVFKDKRGKQIYRKSDSDHACFSIGKMIAYYENGTIRHVNCHYVIKETLEMCEQCVHYRQTLLVLSRRKEVQAKTSSSWIDPSSHVNYLCLDTPQKVQRMKRLHDDNRKMAKRQYRLERKLSEAIEGKGVNVDEELATDLFSVMEEEEQHIENEYPEGSFQRVFWQQQKKAASVKGKKGMRWHPLMIRFCLYIRHHSSKAYEALRQSGCISLPSQRTLRDYSHSVKAMPGFSNEVDDQLKAAAKPLTLKEWEKLVVLLVDEIYIKEDLVYDKHEGTLIGFMNLGEVNNHLLAFEQSFDTDTDSNATALAKTALTFMVKGIFTSLRFPYAYFLCTTLTADMFFQPFWEAVYRIERAKLKVCNNIILLIIVTCDLS